MSQREGEMPVLEGFRLSPQQRRLWSWLQAAPARSGRVGCRVRLEGELSPDRLESACQALVERHEVLRTSFRTHPSTTLPLQVVGMSTPLRFRFRDVRDLPPERRAEAVAAELRAQEEGPLDLVEGPLLDVSLFRSGERSWDLGLCLPALCADRAGVRNLLAGLLRQLSGEAEPVDAPLQYIDVSDILNQLLESDECAEGRAFWRRQDLSVLRLGLEGEVVADPAPLAFLTIPVPSGLAQAVAKRAEEGDVPVAVLLLAAWHALLHRLSGQTGVGTLVAAEGRDFEGLDELPGCFVRHLPVVSQCPAERSFGELATALESSWIEAVEWQHSLSWEELEAARPELVPARGLLFAFEYESRPRSLEKNELRCSLERQYAAAEPCQARLLALDEEGGLSLELAFDSAVWSSERADRLVEQYLALLAHAVREPATRIAELDLLGDRLRHRLLEEINDSGDAPLATKCLHEVFAERAALSPAAPAVVDEDGALSFGELEARANRLAWKLRRLGVSPEDLVGVCLERGAELVVSLLAVLKAGGAYVPLDPRSPARRTAAMLEDARVRLVLTRSRFAADLASHGASVLCLDEEGLEEPAPEAPDSGATSDSLAYVLFTSGSTGRPKGVMIPHGGLANYLSWARSYLDGVERALLHSPLTFDLSVTSLWAPLLAGVTVVLVPEGDEVEGLARALPQGGAALLKLTPSHLDALAALLPAGEPPLRGGALIVGGEALLGESLARWRTGNRRLRIINEYGPTETVVGCCIFEVPEGEISGPIPIGRPIPHIRLYVVDAHLQPVPLGSQGELCIGGVGVARGYLGRPGQTAELFIPDPFSGEAGARLYRTGDLVRHLQEGILEFLGRRDDQVKVRGFRIELGEVEAALRQHPEVRECAFSVRDDAPGGRGLVGYVVPKGTETQWVADLPGFLAERLPEAWQPAALVVVPELPLTAHGKVDRKALPAPQPALQDGSYLALSTPFEQTLASLWARVLGLERIGAEDSFFSLGGHSILAIQLSSRLREVFAVDISVREVFRYPTLRAMARHVETLMTEQRRIEAPPIVPVADADAAVLSFAQERLWFLHQLNPESVAYNLPVLFQIAGKISVPVLARSFREIVRRHEVLRSLFTLAGDRPVQRVGEVPDDLLEPIDLGGIPAPEEEIRRIVRREAARPFDLERGPFLRAFLFTLAPDQHALALLTHHIVFDGSLEVLVRELSMLYDAYSTGGASPLPELPCQYRDFAVWQRRYLSGEVLDRQLHYWRDRLGHNHEPLALPTDRSRPPIQGFRGATRPFTLPAGLKERFQELCRREGGTLFMATLASFQALLHRCSGQSQIRIGTPIADRPRSETESLIGCFINTIVLDARFTPGLTYKELLAQVREAALEGYLHKDLPFELLVEHLQPQRDPSHTPLFQVMFVLHDTWRPTWSVRLEGLRMKQTPLDSGASRFDMTLGVWDVNGWSGAVEYSTDLFDATTMCRLLGHWESSLQGAAANPDALVSSLPLLGEAERFQLLGEWNDTAGEAERGSRLEELFERQVDRDSKRVAVVGDEGSLTYAEVERRANRLANLLRSCGVSRGSRVGVYLRRGLEMVPTLLGVLKAGGSYVPLDASFPTGRLGRIVRRHGVEWVVTQSWGLERLRRLDEANLRHVVSLDAEDETPEAGFQVWGAPSLLRQPESRPSREGSSQDVAYVIFTSGSTGTPKGVVVQHRPAVQVVEWVNREHGVGETDRVLFITSLGFDLSVYDVFGLLAAGGSVRVVAESDVRDPRRLAQLLVEEPVTFWDSAPAALQQLVGFLPDREQGRNSHLRLVFLSGDWIPVELPEAVRASFPSASVIALGGATEAAVWSNFYRVEGPSAEWVSVPYGRPIVNARYYALDEHLDPVPIGVAGDLYIGGECLAWGYAESPDLTADRFGPDPHGGSPGGVLYRTGDQVRWRARGLMEFLGRRDQQVKIRGFRIELGEIESVLREQPGVLDAVAVVVREQGHGRLVAYVVPQPPGPAPGAEELRAQLSLRLPEYMVPSAFVSLETLPLTPNGKLDRQALPAPESLAVQEEQSSHAVPRTPVEEVLAGVWAEVLRRERVGIHDNFFQLGGHSLLATQLISRMSAALRRAVPLPLLFQAPTVAGLAASLEAAAGTGRTVTIPRREPGGPAPLSFAQQRLWYLHQLDPDSGLYNVFLAVHLEGPLDPGRLDAAVRAVVGRHEGLRTSFQSSDEGPVQVVEPAESVVLPVTDLAPLPPDEQEREVRRLARDESERPFNLARGPLLRLRLLRLKAGEHVLLFTLHHVVTDAWSMGILVRELALGYRAAGSAEESPFPDLPIQYADFAQWEREWLQGDVLAERLEYWRSRLAGLIPTELPTDHPRPPARLSRGGRRNLAVSEALWGRLRAVGLRQGATLFMVTLAAFQVLLRSRLGRDDIAVGTNTANRDRLETEGLIGFFINQLVLRIDSSGDPSFLDLVELTREVVLGAFAHQDLPFDVLLAELGGGPLFHIKVEVQNVPMPPVIVPELRFSLLDLDTDIVRYDLHLLVLESEVGMAGALKYDTDLFDATSVADLAEDFEALLAAAADRPEDRISALTGRMAEADRARRERRREERRKSDLSKLRRVQR